MKNTVRTTEDASVAWNLRPANATAKKSVLRFCLHRATGNLVRPDGDTHATGPGHRTTGVIGERGHPASKSFTIQEAMLRLLL
jgi:hypothetical protein